MAEFIGMDTNDENISVVMSNVACTGQESVLASCERFDEKRNCVDNRRIHMYYFSLVVRETERLAKIEV